MNFTSKELSTLSNGIIALIGNATEVKKLVYTDEAVNAIEREIKELVLLNTKICGIISSEQEV